jgi:hypothetical protein
MEECSNSVIYAMNLKPDVSKQYRILSVITYSWQYNREWFRNLFNGVFGVNDVEFSNYIRRSVVNVTKQ